MKIQWYPGHMTKAKRAMSDAIKLVDIIIEMTDARAPEATRNPEIMELGSNKSRIIILNKADLSDESANNRWASHYKEQGYECMFMDSRKKNGVNALIKAIENVSKEKRERDAKRGIKNRPVRAMVAGIPNVGKSTLINSVSGRAMAKTGNKPGVTKGNQWIKLKGQIELLDTPGILMPKFDNQEIGKKLSLIGSIKDDITPLDDVSLYLIELLKNNYLENLNNHYKLNVKAEDENLTIMEKIAEKRFKKIGGDYDYDSTIKLLIQDFRTQKFGLITLDNYNEIVNNEENNED